MSEKIVIGLTSTQAAIETTVDPLLLQEGLALIEQEKCTPFSVAIKQHWRAVLWSCTLSLALVMDGMDGAIVSPAEQDDTQLCHNDFLFIDQLVLRLAVLSAPIW